MGCHVDSCSRNARTPVASSDRFTFADAAGRLMRAFRLLSKGTPTEKCWFSLPRHTRREVMQLARNGRRHPDAQVASVAEEWAHYVVGRPPSRILLKAIYEVVAVGGLYALTHWLFGTSFQDLSFLFFVPFITLPINVEVRSVARRITALR